MGISGVHPVLQKLHEIYSPEFPGFLLPFLEAPALVRLKGIDQTCGYRYSPLSNTAIHYSRFEHSLGVALIIWNFTHDQAQTLSGLFHDISHTVFSHAGDFVYGDAVNQETSEKNTTSIIENDPVIQRELGLLGITTSQVDDYTLYPIADNPGPKLSADRLEYTLSTLVTWGHIDQVLEKVKHMYGDIYVSSNDSHESELAFHSPEIAYEFAMYSIQNDSELFGSYGSILIMQLLADMLVRMTRLGYLTQDDFYTLVDRDVVDMIPAIDDPVLRQMWRVFSTTTGYLTHSVLTRTDNYLISSKCKRRYIDPLVVNDGVRNRISNIYSDFKAACDYHVSRREEWIEVPNSSVFVKSKKQCE